MKMTTPILMVLLAACHAAQPEQPRNFADPAVSEALAGPMMSDLNLQAAASPDALQPADQPATMQIPTEAIVDTRGATTLRDVARMRIREAAYSGCNPVVTYSAQWSIRLPDWIELPDGARVAEAAGSDTPICALRIVRFGIGGTPRQALARYAVLAKRAGFVITSGRTTLAAVRKKDGAALQIEAFAIAEGARIDLTSNRGGEQPRALRVAEMRLAR
jgi:hypothetical protein